MKDVKIKPFAVALMCLLLWGCQADSSSLEKEISRLNEQISELSQTIQSLSDSVSPEQEPDETPVDNPEENQEEFLGEEVFVEEEYIPEDEVPEENFEEPVIADMENMETNLEAQAVQETIYINRENNVPVLYNDQNIYVSVLSSSWNRDLNRLEVELYIGNDTDQNLRVYFRDARINDRPVTTQYSNGSWRVSPWEGSNVSFYLSLNTLINSGISVIDQLSGTISIYSNQDGSDRQLFSVPVVFQGDLFI